MGTLFKNLPDWHSSAPNSSYLQLLLNLTGYFHLVKINFFNWSHLRTTFYGLICEIQLWGVLHRVIARNSGTDSDLLCNMQEN